MGCCCGEGAGGPPDRPPARESFLNQSLKQGLQMNSEQIGKCVEVDTGLLCLCNV